jgi:hypothetical protein
MVTSRVPCGRGLIRGPRREYLVLKCSYPTHFRPAHCLHPPTLEALCKPFSFHFLCSWPPYDAFKIISNVRRSEHARFVIHLNFLSRSRINPVVYSTSFSKFLLSHSAPHRLSAVRHISVQIRTAEAMMWLTDPRLCRVPSFPRKKDVVFPPNFSDG